MLNKLYEKSGLEEYYKNITNININTIIFGLKSKRIKKKLINKKQNPKIFNKISDKNKNDNLSN